jgi:4-hydroxythreonine-4-phosphate dehydrogenase
MIRLALTTGEPAGIGPEISLKAAEIFLQKNLDVQISLIGDEALFAKSFHDRLTVVHTPVQAKVVSGQLNSANAGYVLSTLDLAIDGCLSGHYQAMVTAPVQKSVISESGIKFSGHTEYLAEKCGVPLVVMMLCGKPVFKSDLLPDMLRVALATTHIPLQDISKNLSVDLLQKTIEIIGEDLKNRFDIKQPTIYVSGLNPHAGESGHMGREEIDIIIPAIKLMQQKGYSLVGPLAGDTMFSPNHLQKADVILAMYHDQGLAPFKFATFGEGVNVTLGLPIIRTSVDHGTALNLAGKNIADVTSMLAALEMANLMARNQSGTSGS